MNSILCMFVRSFEDFIKLREAPKHILLHFTSTFLEFTGEENMMTNHVGLYLVLLLYTPPPHNWLDSDKCSVTTESS